MSGCRLYSDYIFLGYGFTPEKFAKDVPKAVDMMEKCLKVNTTRQCVFSNDTYIKLPVSETDNTVVSNDTYIRLPVSETDNSVFSNDTNIKLPVKQTTVSSAMIPISSYR